MSGPKLMGITCDPEVIRRNRERLREIGKQAYYEDTFHYLGIDMDNTATWIQNYGKKILEQIMADARISRLSLGELQKVKDRHIQMIQNRKLTSQDIAEKSARDLNRIYCDIVEGLPKWKQAFIDETEDVFQEFQKQLDQEARERKASEKFSKELEEKNKAQKKRRAAMETASRGMTQGELYEEIDISRRTAAPAEEEEEEESREYTLGELAAIENISDELEHYAKRNGLTLQERGWVEEIRQNLEHLDLSDEHYKMEGKRRLLSATKATYQLLMKSVAKADLQKEAREKERRTLELEYVSFINALSLENRADHYTMEELREEVERLRREVAKQEERIYVEDSMSEIMSKYGYKGVSSVHLHEYEQTSRIFFENQDAEKVSVSFGQGRVMLQVVGEGEGSPTAEERKEQVRQQGALCQIYPEIKEELKKRKINIEMENCAPVSEESAINIPIRREKTLKNERGRHSILNRTFANANETQRRDDLYAERQQAMYMQSES